MTPPATLPDGRALRMHRWIAWIGFVILIVLHLDFWRPQRMVLYFGWLPEEIAYRLLWIALAFLYLVYFCTFVWQTKDSRFHGP